MMKKTSLWYVIMLLFLTGIITAASFSNSTIENKAASPILPKKATKETSSVLAFNTMMQVLTHKRCVNCHPAGDYPKQGEDSHPHLFGVQRGESNLGVAAVNCNACHQDTNNDYSGVPGAPEWSLAPRSMVWEGLSSVEIARSMMDPKRNGNKTPEQIEHHLTEHELVLWAFEPGVNAEGIPREKPPVSKEEYIAAVKKWFEEGAVIPEE